MGDVRVMSDSLASQVAAGEVVERPSSVVKELIENSLDADSKRIDIVIERGGRALIRIVDDGNGMSREDAVLSIERHATSKLNKRSDLDKITTYGFRGEALPSIASVAKFKLSTRQHGALAGTEIVIDGGKLKEVLDSGDAPGTQVEVRSLFFNVPARKKFLRAEATEFARIETVVRVAAVCRHDVAFSLLHGDRNVLQVGSAVRKIDRILDLIGTDYADNLIELCDKDTSDGIRVSGWVSKPGTTRPNRRMQFTFVNERSIENTTISYAVREAYKGMIERGCHPLLFLFLEMDPIHVDVNMHPTKKEVRFRNQSAVQKVLADTITRSLKLEFLDNANNVTAAKWALNKSLPEGSECDDSEAGDIVELEDPFEDHFEVIDERDVSSVIRVGNESQQSISSKDCESFRILGVLSNKYLVLESPDGLVLMHRRAAHERILYEEAISLTRQDGKVMSQSLLTPVILHLLPEDFQVASDAAPFLEQLGIGIEIFGGNSIKIGFLPSSFSGKDPLGFVSSIIAEIRDGGADLAKKYSLSEIAKAVSYKASRYCESKTEEEMEALISRLLSCEMPYVDARGRPTLIQFSLREIARKFGDR